MEEHSLQSAFIAVQERSSDASLWQQNSKAVLLHRPQNLHSDLGIQKEKANEKNMFPPEPLYEPMLHPPKGIIHSTSHSHASPSSSGCKAFQKKLYHLGDEVRRGCREVFPVNPNAKHDPCVPCTANEWYLSAPSSGLEEVHPASSFQETIRIPSPSDVLASPFCSHIRVREDRRNGAPLQDSTDSAKWYGNFFYHPLHRYTLLLGHRNTPFLEDLFTVSRKKGTTRKRSRSCCPNLQLSR